MTSFFKEAKLRREVELQDHQLRLQKKLEDTDAILAYHSLGSGKTLSAIAATEGLRDRTVIVPASLRPNFRKELKTHTDQKTPTKVMSYEQATKDLPSSDALVIDEAHRLSGLDSLRSQAVRAGAKRFKKRILLSGSPIRNKPSDLAPLIHVLDPGSRIPLDPHQFNQHFIEEKKVSPGLIDRLIFGMAPGVTRRAKNIPELRSALKGKVDYFNAGKDNYPSRRDEIVHVPMSADQREIYDTVANKANPGIARKIRSNFPMSRAESGNLNAFLTGPRIASTTTRPYGGRKVTPKLERVVANMERGMRDDPDYKSISHSSYLEGGLNDLSHLLTERGISHGVFKGGLSDKERGALVEDYNSGKLKHLLLSDAASEGISLTGTRAVHMLTPQWTMPAEAQIAGRAIRFGSHAHLPKEKRNVTVYHYHSVLPKKWHQKLLGRKADTGVDDYMHALAKKKEKLNEEFLDVLRQEGSAPA